MEVDRVQFGVADADLGWVLAVVQAGVDRKAGAGLVWPIRLIIVSSETSGFPRQFIVM